MTLGASTLLTGRIKVSDMSPPPDPDETTIDACGAMVAVMLGGDVLPVGVYNPVVSVGGALQICCGVKNMGKPAMRAIALTAVIATLGSSTGDAAGYAWVVAATASLTMGFRESIVESMDNDRGDDADDDSDDESRYGDVCGVSVVLVVVVMVGSRLLLLLLLSSNGGMLDGDASVFFALLLIPCCKLNCNSEEARPRSAGDVAL